ncbi:MAG: glutamate synthase large subunit [Pseudomonadota bacterium]
MNNLDRLAEHGLYDPSFERDNCGFGLIAHMDGEPSHWVVNTAITALARLTHRGAVAADGKSGDGCGLLLKKPDTFLRAAAAETGLSLPNQYATALVFLSQDAARADAAIATLERALDDRGLTVVGWRTPPTDHAALGEHALQSLPRIEQLFVGAPDDMDTATFNRHLFVARRRTEVAHAGDPSLYIPSMTADVVLYKGMVMPENLPVFYQDLQRDDLASSIAVFHQRFSTNTLPEWRLAQPFRYLAHNGEINTIRGNRNWARARTQKLTNALLPELPELTPVISMSGSDSSSLDNMLEVLINGGMDIFTAMRTLIPPAWQNNDDLPPDMRAFLQYNSMHMEPWDGPAGIVLTDGRYAGCSMDRNGLRPARYVITRDRHITLASEIGVYDYAPEDVTSKGRLRPGQMFAVDTDTGELLLPKEIDQQLAQSQPWARWLRDHSRQLRSRLRDDIRDRPPLDREDLRLHEKMFGLTFEERDQILRALAEDGQEAIGSMGDDTPYPVMSQLPRSLFDNFRQQFAQVTNPPIDPLRESIVMSLETCLGAEVNLFEAGERGAKRLVVRSPILSRAKFETLRAMSDEREYRNAIIDLNYDPNQLSLKDKIDAVCKEAIARVRAGDSIIILNDRRLRPSCLPAHALLATGAVHHALIEVGLRCDANIIVATGTARDPHHMACLIGYGATCVFPYLAYESLNGMVASGQIDEENIDVQDLEQNYRKGINKGLLKILSKMGISGVTSYRGAQLFEIVGLADEVVDTCFTGTTSRIQGADFDDLQADSTLWAAAAEDPTVEPDQGGLLKFIHGGEYHVYNPDVVKTLQAAVTSGEWSDYEAYRDTVDERPPVLLRDLLTLTSDKAAISIDEVEPVEAILSRFDSAGMSLGALSPEAHETLAEAMNRLGGRSNSGEGGEDPARYGTEKVSKIKQIASGRFGVTPHYLVNAEVLQIKVAQGAKPGEGGQLPGHKVNRMIAKLRHSMPGVALISPPPHHDIYSIEDLAQLIFDLKQVNPDALVSVKLVAEPGVGTVAAGVAKCYADLITISGYDGGTGASPLTSVKYAGSPWELGMSETHQVLRANNLRDKVRVQCDGGLKTGLDVIKAAALGAESFGFGTGPMIAMGCKFLRICHLNNCATGVATQHKVLRMRHFNGNVDKVMNYMRFIAEDVRRILASLGLCSLEELIGRPEYLEQQAGVTARQAKIDLSPVLSDGGIADNEPRFCLTERNTPFDAAELAERIVADCLPAIEEKRGGRFHYELKNVDRSIGARLSGEIARRHGTYGMADAPIDVQFSGTAGQSFGVWNAAGLNMELIGDANDYVGKGMAGGRLVIRPPVGAVFSSRETPIIGNTCLYGATGGELFAAGLAGERFAVRNSGVVAVVEGLGDHGCEYMTGGCVVSLGPTGVNFGAGMTGGFAFVLDQERHFVDRYNHELVEIARIHTEESEAYRHHLTDLLERYVDATHSAWGHEVLDNFYAFQNQFWLVKPKALELEQLFSTLRRAA